MGYRTISHWRGHGILGVYSHDDTNAVPESQSSYSHPLSSSTKVRSPEASTMVALLAAKFWLGLDLPLEEDELGFMFKGAADASRERVDGGVYGSGNSAHTMTYS
jgi:hypothetical protein